MKIGTKVAADTITQEIMVSRYEQAKHLMQGILSKTVVFNTTVYPIWIGDSDCFWYVRENKESKEYRLVDANAGSNERAFDHCVLANVLANLTEKKVDYSNLSLTDVEMEISLENKKVASLNFTAFEKRWRYDVLSEVCQEQGLINRDWSISPDGKQAAFVRDCNLWVCELESGKERALTTDGEALFTYGVAGSGWGYTMESAVQTCWSNDSTRIFTVRRDTRDVKDLPVMHHVPNDGSYRPTVTNYKIAYPGDEYIETLKLISIQVQSGLIQEANYRQIPTTRNSWGFFKSKLGWWSRDNRRAYFVDMERDYKTVRVVEFDTDTGATKVLFEEVSDTQINLMLNADDHPALLPLPETGELLWFSERSGWAHLYLYNLESGDLKNIVTQGDWLVRHAVSVDLLRREVFIQTAGRVAGRDPYYRDLCRVHIDTGEITEVVSSDHDINVIMQTELNTITMVMIGAADISLAGGVSPSGNFSMVTQSRADTVPVSFLVDRNGNNVLEIETADVSGLPDNWQWPEPVKLFAADGETDIYGLVYRPSHFSPDQSYPVVSHVFNTPELPWVPKGSFTNGGFFGWTYLDAAALAELGFVVVQIDGRGTPYRNKAFHDESYGRLELVSTLDDHVAGIQQLSERYPYIDTKRAGITSQATGGPGGLQGLLQHPEFYKVGVSLMPHDSRLIPGPMWGEKYEGLSGPHSESLYPEVMVEKLQGKLLLINGMLDTSCPPAIIFRLVEALQKANKDFDLLLFPNLGHSSNGYLIRRSWDYLVKNLLGLEPPKEFKLTTFLDG